MQPQFTGAIYNNFVHLRYARLSIYERYEHNHFWALAQGIHLGIFYFVEIHI